MMPVYRNMEAYSNQRNQSGYQQTFPAYIPINPFNPPMHYQSWPHGANHSYPYPIMPYSSSCNHGHFPGCHNCPTSYYPEPYPFHYAPPPQRYSMGWNQEHRGCGAPGIEERKEIDYFEPKKNGSLVPVHLKGHPSRIAWIPDEYVMEKMRPFDADKLDYLVDDGDDKRDRDQKTAKQKMDYPFPFIWMPNGKQEENGVDVNRDKVSEVRGSEFQFPEVLMPSQDTRKKVAGDKDDSKEASASPKQIDKFPYTFNFVPMRQLGNDNGSKDSKTNVETVFKNDTEAEAMMRGLPPVCLRVDPLPKKNGSGRSRSLSPNSKGRSQQNLGKPKEVLVTEKIDDQHQVSVTNASEVKVERKLGKKVLSDAEAALRIQSMYRGFEVRRSQPLKKLKQIAEVHEQLVDVRNRIHAFQSSSDLKTDEKQRLIIGETIMRLLLQLDTVQGLLPSLRDIRKSLAKELVSLQDELDSLVIQSKHPKLNSGASGSVEALATKEQGKPEEEIESKNDCDDVPKSTCNVTESVQDQLLPTMDSEQEESSVCAFDNAVSNIASEDLKNIAESIVAMDLIDAIQVDNLQLKEDTKDTDVDDNKETVLAESPVQVIDDGHTESETNTGQVEMVYGNEVKLSDEEVMVAKADAAIHVLADPAISVLDKDDNEDSENESKIEKSEEPLEEKPVVEEASECEKVSSKNEAAENLEAKSSTDKPIEENIEAKHSKEATKNAEVCVNDEVVSILKFSSLEAEAEQEGGKTYEERRVVGENNNKLKEIMEKLIEAGNSQLSVISDLSERVRDLEKKLSRTRRGNKLRTKQRYLRNK